MNVYAAYCKDQIIRNESSSGAIFTPLAHYVLDNGGVIYGVKMTKDCYRAIYERVEEKKELVDLRGSKYMQAHVGDTFRKVKSDLLIGRIVLFVGTACQINGVKTFLQVEYDNLFCVDILCHGVPSPLLWKKYAIFLEKSIGKLNKVNFRSKEQGWYDSGVKENEYFTLQSDHVFMRLFLSDYGLRPSCYACTAKDYKMSDITLGDLWGVKSVAPELDDNRGLSVIFVRTDKGEKLISKIKESLIYKNISYDEGIEENPAEYSSVARPKQRNRFYRDMKLLSFERLCTKYLEVPLWRKIVRKTKQVLKNFIGKG